MDTSNNSSETSHNNNEQMVIRSPSYCNNHAYSFFCMPIIYSNNGYQPIPMIPVPVPITIPTPTPIAATLPTSPLPIPNHITTATHIPSTTNICQDIHNLYPVRVSDSNSNNTEENSRNGSDMHIQVGQYFKDANALCTAIQMYHLRISKRVRVHKIVKNIKITHFCGEFKQKYRTKEEALDHCLCYHSARIVQMEDGSQQHQVKKWTRHT